MTTLNSVPSALLTTVDTTGTLTVQTNSVNALSINGSQQVTTSNLSSTVLSAGQMTTSSSILNASGRPMVNQTGGILQVQSFTYNTVFSSSSTGYVVTPLTLSITPSSTSSKLFIFGHANFGMTSSGVGKFALYRNGSILSGGNGNNSGYGSAVSIHGWSDYNNSDDVIPGVFHYLDSPASTSSQTYTIYFEPGNGPGTWYLNRATSLDTSTDNGGIGVSTMTIMEIAG